MATSQFISLSAASDFKNSFMDLETHLRNKNAARSMDPARQSAQPAQPAQSDQPAPPKETPQPAAAPASAASDATNTAPPPEPPSAVAVCGTAYSKAYDRAKEKGRSDFDCRRDANRAYINAIPRLQKPENIQGFIDCVAYAMLIDVIRPTDGTKILYAAQIALQSTSAGQASSKIANRNNSTSKNPK